MMVNSCLGLQWDTCFLVYHGLKNAPWHTVHLLIYGIEKIIQMENVKCMYINPFSQMSVRLVNFCQTCVCSRENVREVRLEPSLTEKMKLNQQRRVILDIPKTFKSKFNDLDIDNLKIVLFCFQFIHDPVVSISFLLSSFVSYETPETVIVL